MLGLLIFFFKRKLSYASYKQLIYWGWGRRWEGIWILFFICFWDWLKGWVCWRCCLKYIKKINLGQRELFFIWFFWSGTSQMPLVTWQSEDWAWIIALLLKTQSSNAWLLGCFFPFRFGFFWFFFCLVFWDFLFSFGLLIWLFFVFVWWFFFLRERNQFGLGFCVAHSWCSGGVCACRTALTDWYLQSFDDLLLPFWRVHACRKFGLK